jgi:hypothetical protein
MREEHAMADVVSLADLIARCLSTELSLHQSIPNHLHGAYVKLRPIVDGVEYEIKISARNPAAAARARFEQLKRNPEWAAKALDPDTDEGREFADLQRRMAGGRPQNDPS